MTELIDLHRFCQTFLFNFGCGVGPMSVQ